MREEGKMMRKFVIARECDGHPEGVEEWVFDKPRADWTIGGRGQTGTRFDTASEAVRATEAAERKPYPSSPSLGPWFVMAVEVPEPVKRGTVTVRYDVPVYVMVDLDGAEVISVEVLREEAKADFDPDGDPTGLEYEAYAIAAEAAWPDWDVD